MFGLLNRFKTHRFGNDKTKGRLKSVAQRAASDESGRGQPHLKKRTRAVRRDELRESNDSCCCGAGFAELVPPKKYLQCGCPATFINGSFRKIRSQIEPARGASQFLYM